MKCVSRSSFPVCTHGHSLFLSFYEALLVSTIAVWHFNSCPWLSKLILIISLPTLKPTKAPDCMHYVILTLFSLRAMIFWSMLSNMSDSFHFDYSLISGLISHVYFTQIPLFNLKYSCCIVIFILSLSLENLVCKMSISLKVKLKCHLAFLPCRQLGDFSHLRVLRHLISRLRHWPLASLYGNYLCTGIMNPILVCKYV